MSDKNRLVTFGCFALGGVLGIIVGGIGMMVLMPYSLETQAVEFTVTSQVLLPNSKFCQVQTHPMSR